MLVLTRKRNEMIRIGDDIVIKVIRTGKGSVKLGIEAPADVRVLRGELSEEETSHTPAPHATFIRVPDGELERTLDCDNPAVACSDQFPHVVAIA